MSDPDADTSPERRYQAPLSIYVVYHPQTPESRDLANALFDWFRLDQPHGQSGGSSEAGLPIWIRARVIDSDEGPQAKPQVSPPIIWDAAELNVLVLLVDDRMAADRRWRLALERLREEAAESPSTDLLLPVAVDYSLYRLNFLYEFLNPIRVGEPRPAKEPEHPPVGSEAAKAREARIHSRSRLLRRAVTEAITRELRTQLLIEGEAAESNQPTSPAKRSYPAPLQVFLSHAKADGTQIAEAIRDNLANLSQMRPWYDANELPPGYDWDPPMSEAAKHGSAVLLCVVSDAYPTRHWCRREVTLAREPRPLPLPADARANVEAWTVQPVVAVHQARGSWSRPMAQLAQVPHVGWPDDPERVPDRVADVVDRLLLEALLVSFYRRFAQLNATRPTLLEGKADNRHLVLITWIPDPWSLILLLGHLRQYADKELVIAYPGHGLRTAEVDELTTLLETMRDGTDETRVHLISQEQLYVDARERGEPFGLTVAMSGGGGDDDLEPYGTGPRHVDDLFTRLARRLLGQGCTLLYGGTLGIARSNLTMALIETARGWKNQQSRAPVAPATRRKAKAEDLDRTPFINYSTWPHYRAISLAQKADLTGVCEFFEVDPPGVDPLSLPRDPDPESPHVLRMAADAISEMRRLTSEHADARIVVGGKVEGWSGWLPGITEEVLCDLEAGKAPIILAGFGGCATVLAEYLQDPEAPWPAVLSFEHASHSPRLRRLFPGGFRDQARAHFTRLQVALERYRDQLHGDADWPFELERELLLALLPPRGASSSLNLVHAALAKLAKRRGPAAPTS
ncbi:TIR domain-containing protein [Pseudenhygromyxa sp. WMMC2535]|uniref:TIR domain-containing protein n=1 Tax=Pseudenhygromyxa sp. WMMC2535 TaxID=2712867 RepID=UPI0015555018|nr:TIR domain-containing protein [Pseudenhygromyxa sp. WMMC2535]NVB37304.1 TIR domain-containing protein [Pseudenhygromyxa sp. WMMC2535]